MSLLDDAFALLETANALEEKGDGTEAATKYYEACYLMRRFVAHLPQHRTDERELIQEKVDHYQKLASRLLNGHNPVTPRSPLEGECFFQEDTSVIPILPPPAPSHQPVSPQFRSNQAKSAVSEITDKAGRANTRLANALDLDEGGLQVKAIEEYMGAAELYLAALRLAESNAVISVLPLLKGRLEAALDRVEQLKHPKGVLMEPRVKQHHHQLQQGQQLDSSRSLTQEEVDVLKRSSLIASGLFLPWSDEDAQQLSREGSSSMTTKYKDPKGMLHLNDKQKARFHKFARPSEICKLRGCKLSMVKSITPYSIRQQFVTDCSFIASLVICSAFERRFRKRLVTSIIYPQTQDGMPAYNPAGKYMVKLWLNGVARQVIVDDFLPIDKHGNILCSRTSNTSSLELWVSIIEKAYMKMCGGYDFPGSNSGVDLFSLTGWIPERIFFPKNPAKVRDFETPAERAWERLYSASSYGDCLITVSTTSDLSECDADTLGLVTGHAYAVLSVIETRNKTRLLQLKNPWAHKSWKGKYSATDQATWSNKQLCHEVGYDARTAAKVDDGVFWISWDDVLRYFQNLHLSWNPALFKYRISTHAFWPLTMGPKVDTFNVGENPQYILSFSDAVVAKKPTVWILLSRHVTKQEQEGAEASDFLTVHVHRGQGVGHRIWYPSSKTTLLSGAYSNNPHVLVRYDVAEPADKYLSLVLSQYEKSNDLTYTLSCYCTEDFGISRPAKDPPFSVQLTGEWDEHSAGGPPGSKSFDRNPMWAVKLKKETHIQARVSAAGSFAVNVMLVPVHELGKRIKYLTTKPPVDSGSYRHGFAVAETKKVPSGDYALVVSTFEPQQQGAFIVDLFSSSGLKTYKI